MKNKTIFKVSLLLIAFVIAFSYAPIGANQAVMAQETAPYDSIFDLPETTVKGTYGTRTKEELDQVRLASNAYKYIVPGFAFQRASDKPATDTGTVSKSWLNRGQVKYENFTNPDSRVELNFPILIPEGSMITSLDLCGQIESDVTTNDKIQMVLFRYHWTASNIEEVGRVSITKTDGLPTCQYLHLNEPHEFEPYAYNYYLLVSLPASATVSKEYLVSQAIIGYTYQYPIFGAALPFVTTVHE